MKFNFYIILTIFSLTFLPTCIFAQNRPTAEKIKLMHIPPSPDSLPSPGQELKISVTLSNTKNSQLILRGFFVRDGKILEEDLNEFSTDLDDHLVYSVKINAPLAELNYRFILLDGQTPITSSERYSVRRNCIPDTNSIDTKIPSNIKGQEKEKLLQSQVTSLQNEIENYEKAIKMLDELKILTES